MLRESNFEVDLPLLQEIAFGYAIDDPQSVPTSVDPAIAIGGEHTRLRYTEWSKINVLAELDNQISRFSQKVLSMRKAARQVSADLAADLKERRRIDGELNRNRHEGRVLHGTLAGAAWRAGLPQPLRGTHQAPDPGAERPHLVDEDLFAGSCDDELLGFGSAFVRPATPSERPFDRFAGP